MINGAIKRALQVAKMRAGRAPTTHVPTPPQAPPPKREDMPVDPTRSKSAQERQKFQDGGIAAPYGVIDLGDKVILGAPHGEPIELSNGLKQRVKQIAAKHGAWYEGDPKDVGPNQELLGGPDAYRGSWDDAVARNVKGYPLEYLAPLFSNVDVNRQHETFANPQQTIFDSLLSNQAKARYFKDRDYDRDTLANFLKQGSEKDADLMRMAASPATKENLQKFFSTGEKLMWPENWQEYPNKLGKIAKRFEDSRNKFLKDAGPGVYVTGAGHIPELRNTFKDLKVIGGERAGYAKGGGTPTPPRRPVEFAGEDASRAFPGIWKNVDPVVKYNMGRQRGYAETYPPKETGDPNNPKSTRPKEFPIDRTGIEVYRPEMSGSDLALELLHADPNAIKTRNTLLSTMSPQQLEELRNRLDYEDPEGNLTPQRRYDNAMDASMRSYLANKRDLPHSQGPASDIEYMQYTDEQKQHLDKLYDYMMSGKYADGGVVEDLNNDAFGESSQFLEKPERRNLEERFPKPNNGYDIAAIARDPREPGWKRAGAIGAGVASDIAKGAWEGIKKPGQALRGEWDPSGGQGVGASDEAVEWATNTGLGALGTGTAFNKAPKGAIGSFAGIRGYHGGPAAFPAERLVRLPTGEQQYLTGRVDRIPSPPTGAEVIKDYPLGRFKDDFLNFEKATQSYGPGNYIATKPDVADIYREGSSHGTFATPKGNPWIIGEELFHPKIQMATSGRGINAGISRAEELLNNPNLRSSERQSIIDDRDTLRLAQMSGVKPNRGHMYELNINENPENFADWDKSIAVQPEPVREWANKLISGYKDKQTARQMPMTLGGVYLNRASGLAKPGTGFNLTGPDLGMRAASQELRELGVPGIRYLGPDSAYTAPNYVVFDPKLIDILKRYARGGTVERPTKMNKKVKHALDVALSETHPKRFHHTLARTGYADGGLPDMNISPPDLANEVPYTHEKALASQFDVAKSAPYKPKSMKLGITKIAPPKKVGLRAPRSDIGKMRLRKNISVKPKKFKLASGGHPEIDDALRLASRTMSNMAKNIGDEGVHGASMQQGSTSTIVKEKVPGKKSEIVYEHHAKTPTETETFASGGGAWTRKEGQNLFRKNQRALKLAAEILKNINGK